MAFPIECWGIKESESCSLDCFPVTRQDFTENIPLKLAQAQSMCHKGQVNILIENSIVYTKTRFLQPNVAFRHHMYSAVSQLEALNGMDGAVKLGQSVY